MNNGARDPFGNPGGLVRQLERHEVFPASRDDWLLGERRCVTRRVVTSEGKRYAGLEGINDDTEGEELVGLERPCHVLLVDEAVADRALLRRALLAGAGHVRYRFTEVATAEQALAWLLEGALPDALLLDLQPSDASGIPLISQLREHYGDLPLPVIVLTAERDAEEAAQALRLGAQDYISKAGATPEILPRIVQNAIQRFQLLEKLKASQQQAARANRAKSSFLANISHEIRTPMTAILGFTDLLAEGETDPERRRLLAMIRENGDYLVELLSDVLDLSKVEAGVLGVALSQCHPGPLVRSITSSLARRAEEKGLELRVEIHGPVPERIWTDPIRVRQILINLVSNAVKFTERGSVVVSVRIDRCGPIPRLEIAVVDTGVGIDEERLEEIFTPFVQIDASSSRRSPGVGLGLAISRRLAEALGGSLSAESSVGAGSRFELVIPILAVPPGNASPEGNGQSKHPTRPAPPFHPCQHAQPLAGHRILVAEDTRALQFLVRRILQSAGAEVEVVENGRQAVDRIMHATVGFDVVLMDMHMPGMDGYEATALLRQSNYQRPIIALTASAISGDQSECLGAGCDGYLPKPIDREALVSAILWYCAAAEKSQSRSFAR